MTPADIGYSNGNGVLARRKSQGYSNGLSLPSAQPDEAQTIDPSVQSESELVTRLMQVFDLYRTCRQRRDIERIWKASIISFRGMKAQRTDPMKDSIVIKETFRQMFTLWPQYTKQFYSQPLMFNYEPQVAGTEEKMRVATQTVHNGVKRLKQKRNILQWGFTKFLMGKSYIMPTWQTFRRSYMSPFRLQDPETGYWIDRETHEVVEMGPVMEFIPPNEIYSHPQVSDPRMSPFVFWHRIVSGRYLKTRVKEGYLSYEAVKQVSMDQLGASAGGLVDQYTVGPYGVENYNDALRLESLPNNDVPHEMLVCWCPDEGMEYVVIDREVLARSWLIEGGMESPDGAIQPGPVPLIAKTNYGMATINEAWGIPEPYTIIDDQGLLNEQATMHRDIMGLTGGPMWKASSNGAQALRNFVAKPGAILWLNKINDADMIPPTKFDQQSINNMQYLEQRMKNVSGMFDNLAGSGDQGANTATMGSKLQEAATVRVADRCLEDMDAEEDLWEAVYKLYNRNLQQDVKFAITGEDGNPAFMIGTAKHFDEASVVVKVVTAPLIDNQAAQKWMNAFMNLGKAPFANARAIAKKWLSTLDIGAPVEQYFVDPQRVQVDTMQQNKDWERDGALPDPVDSENHQLAIQIHQMETQTPVFMTAPPWKQAVLLRHIQIHMNYAQAMMQQAGASAGNSPQGPAPGPGTPPQDQTTNAMFGNGNTGAAQQGAPPPNPMGPQMAPMPQAPPGAPPQ